MHTASSGGRRLTKAALVARAHVLAAERTVTRKELAQAARDAEIALSMSPVARAVLRELVGSWGENELGRKMLVWPSNEYLVRRSGFQERAVRKAVRILTELEILTPKDSANGKRYAVRNEAGEIVDAFGFDLTPLYARRGEFVAMIAEQKRLTDIQGRRFDEITIARRATQEALSALRAHFPDVDASDLGDEFDGLAARTPRRGFMGPIEAVMNAWGELRQRAEQRFFEAGNGGTSCRHKDTNKGPPTESCTKAFSRKAESVRQTEQGPPALSIGLIVEACPALEEYGLRVRDGGDLVAAARYLRPGLGAHESAWTEAIETLGAVPAAAAMILVLQLHTDDVAAGTNRIRNPGGYFRALVRMIAERRFNLEVELLALRRRRMS